MLEALETAKERLRSRLFRRAEFQSLEAKRGDSNTAGKTRGSMPFARRTSLEISAVFNPAHHDSILLLKVLRSLCPRSVLPG